MSTSHAKQSCLFSNGKLSLTSRPHSGHCAEPAGAKSGVHASAPMLSMRSWKRRTRWWKGQQPGPGGTLQSAINCTSASSTPNSDVGPNSAGDPAVDPTELSEQSSQPAICAWRCEGRRAPPEPNARHSESGAGSLNSRIPTKTRRWMRLSQVTQKSSVRTRFPKLSLSVTCKTRGVSPAKPLDPSGLARAHRSKASLSSCIDMKSCSWAPSTLPDCSVTIAANREAFSVILRSSSKGTTTSQTMSNNAHNPELSL
mmetsp:Transcript_56470/g.156407  ORF Transcript_56470/g.156407 Transcript_56470/m.156407 type:complete len:256 (-) Transcript_56470:51-818(-)